MPFINPRRQLASRSATASAPLRGDRGLIAAAIYLQASEATARPRGASAPRTAADLPYRRFAPAAATAARTRRGVSAPR